MRCVKCLQVSNCSRLGAALGGEAVDQIYWTGPTGEPNPFSNQMNKLARIQKNWKLKAIACQRLRSFASNKAQL